LLGRLPVAQIGTATVGLQVFAGAASRDGRFCAESMRGLADEQSEILTADNACVFVVASLPFSDCVEVILCTVVEVMLCTVTGAVLLWSKCWW